MILVFAGAGASKATSADKYPTTVDFYRKLPPDILRMPMFRAANLYIENQLDRKGPIDIEELLWTLDDMHVYAEDFVAGRNFLGAIFQVPDVSQAISPTTDPRIPMEFAKTLGQASLQLTQLIDVLVYEFYGQSPTPDELESAWAPLLRGLLGTTHWIEIFSTNYDLVIEDAIEHVQTQPGPPVLITGRTTTVHPHLELESWTESSPQLPTPNRRGMFTKLHGSIDWSRSGNTIHVGTPLFTGDVARHLIIYPGVKHRQGVTFSTPFSEFQDHFAKAVPQAQALVFLGFSFRDEKIRECLVSSVASGATIFAIDPSPLDLRDLFPKNKVVHIKESFDLNAVSQLLSKLGEMNP